MIGKIFHLVLTLLIATACAQGAIDNTETVAKVDSIATGDFLASMPPSNSSENHRKSEDNLWEGLGSVGPLLSDKIKNH